MQHDDKLINGIRRIANVDGIQLLGTVEALPTASSELAWQIIGVRKVQGTSADIYYMCLADSASTSGYSWVQIATGNHGASGTGSVLSAATTDVITHGLPYTPTIDQIIVTFAEQGDNDYGRWWVSTITSTQFTVNVSADPGASNLDFGWRILV